VPLSQNENSFVFASACRRSPPLTRHRRHALVRCVCKGTTKRGQRLGAVVVPATRLCRARQNQAWFGTIRVGTAARNRRDPGCGFADVIVGATQWRTTDTAEGFVRLSLCIARCLVGKSRSWPRRQERNSKQYNETRRNRFLHSWLNIHSCDSSKSSTGSGGGTASGAGASGGPAGNSDEGIPPVGGSSRISQPPPSARNRSTRL